MNVNKGHIHTEVFTATHETARMSSVLPKMNHIIGCFLAVKLMWRSLGQADFPFDPSQHFYMPSLRFFPSSTFNLPFGQPLRACMGWVR